MQDEIEGVDKYSLKVIFTTLEAISSYLMIPK